MSHSTYNKLWANAQVELNSLLAQEFPVQPPRPEKDRVVFFQRLATLYVRYVQIFRQLEEAYDQVVHPQKRRVIREVLDGVMGRVLELKNEMVEKEFSEYHYMDDVIQDLKLTPEDIEIPIPRYFLSERSKVLQEKGNMLSNILNLMAVVERPKPVGVRALNLEEAIKIIQVSERARQGRLRAKFMREIQRDEERQRRAKDRDLGAAAIGTAVVRIQKVWKGYVQRKKTKREREEEMIFLGMAMEPRHIQPCPATTAAQANEAHRRGKQEEHEEDYQKSIVAITDKLREVEGPDMRETMKDQIRQWFIECHDATGTFPDYPEEEDGGSTLIFAEKTPQQLMEELAAKDEEDTNKKLKGKEENKDKGKKDKGKGGDEEEEPGLKMLPSAFLGELEVGHKTFGEVWQNRTESKNFSQRHEAELIKEEKRKEIEVEIRLQVDELMRQELANWKLAVDKDKGGKAKGGAKKKKGSKSGKKKKKDKDLTADRNIESLYQELVEQGLLKQADNVKLQDYLGDYSYLGTTLRQTDIEPMPSLSDVRQVIALYAVLPLGSQVVHEKAPLVKAILLAGPAGVGKKMLVHAICQETGANLFDLSPQNLAGKYPGKSGLTMMLHMVFKVARLMQPSVVWIGDTEKMFYKKVPKEEKELDPKRLKKDLPKILKSIKGEDRVLVVGTTQDPFNADLKSLCKVYSKIILIPRPDYASRYVMWRQLIKKNGGQVTAALDLSSLAKISDGYTQGHMVQVVCSILTERRVQQLAKRPLSAAEFVAPLAKIDPVFQDEEEALKNWYAKTPLGKKRAKAASGKEGEEEAPTKGGKDAKKKGKK
ncbi:dynein regulatory complex protein 11 isoform X2 [Coregonus clupeaformis]|uniref:dynein regulatory complex protein 11 isoform X2 n=1 Tax=Coregonus clupeaformis TaxID=59861 RepID=UPI001E1C58F1|nr:dynein regulatory complex protein 11 isoform X2 [Coregonus clupeaformis]